MCLDIKKFAQQLINIVEGKKKSKDALTTQLKDITFERSEIELPSIFGLTIRTMSKSNRSKKDFLKTILELRKEEKTKKIREILQIQDRALRSQGKTEREKSEDKKELKKLHRDLKKFLDEEENVNSLTVKAVNILEKIGPIISGAAALAGFSSYDDMTIKMISASAFGVDFSPSLLHYFKGRRLIFLKDLQKEVNEIRLYNDKLESIFGSKLSSDEINRLYKLRSRQKGYLTNSPIFKMD